MTETSLNTSQQIDIKCVTLLLVLCASWGLNQVAIKMGVAEIPPIFQAGLRSVGAALLVGLWMKFREQKIIEKDGSLWWGLLAGVLFSGEFIFIYWGLEFTNASRSAIFLNTSPFVVAIGTHFIIKTERLNRVQMAGMAIAFAGIILAFNDALQFTTGKMLLGDAMLLVAALFWGAVTVTIKASPLTRIPSGKTLLYQLGVSAPILLALSVLKGEQPGWHWGSAATASLIYQIVWVAFITYFAWFWLIQKYPVSRIAPFTFLTPLFGVLSGALLLGEPLTPTLVFALCLVGTGIYLVNH